MMRMVRSISEASPWRQRAGWTVPGVTAGACIRCGRKERRFVIPIVVISLADAAERRTAMRAQMHTLGLPFEFFDAIDGRTLAPERARLFAHAESPREGRRLLAGEIGCSASHFSVVERIAAGSSEFVCVLEDDAVLTPGLKAFLEPQVLRKLEPFGVLRLERSWSGRHIPVGAVGDSLVCAPFRAGVGSRGQIYSRSGAQMLARHLLPIRDAWDVALYVDCRLPRLRVLDIAPAVVAERVGESTIERTGAQSSGYAPRLYRLAQKYRRLRNFLFSWGLPAATRFTK
jgi:glycosyl transferase, family 25